MGCSTQICFPTVVFTATIIFISFSPSSTQATDLESQSNGRGAGSRSLLSFKETPKGSNVTFECSPSGPCVACGYSEKNDEKYRCSETGYRIPLKCLETKNASKEKNDKKLQKSRSTLENSSTYAKTHVTLQDSEEVTSSIKHRRLRDASSTKEGGKQVYITYRSCIPSANEEKLSVFGFEIHDLDTCLIRMTKSPYVIVPGDNVLFVACKCSSYILEKETNYFHVGSRSSESSDQLEVLG